MAPEQARGEIADIDARTDVFGLGSILYEVLTAAPPYAGKSFDETHRQACAGKVSPPSERAPGRNIPEVLEAICLKCMEKLGRDRYPSAAALAQDLQRFLDGEPTQARPLTPFARRWRWLRRSRAAQVNLAVALVALLVVGGLLGFYSSTRADLEALQDKTRADEAGEEAAREETVAALRTTLRQVVDGDLPAEEAVNTRPEPGSTASRGSPICLSVNCSRRRPVSCSISTNAQPVGSSPSR